MKRILEFLLFCGILFFAVGDGAAMPILIEDNVSDNLLVSSQNAIQGVFDVQSLLRQTGNQLDASCLTGGVLHFSFSDNDDLVYTGSYSSFMKRFYNGEDIIFESRRFDVFWDNPEMVAVHTLGQTLYRHTDVRNLLSESGRMDEVRCFNLWGAFDYVHITEFYNQTVGYGGDILVSLKISDYWLSHFLTTGFLNYDLTAWGDLIFKSAQLEFDYEPNTTPAPAPEPSTLVLLSTGLLLLVRRQSFHKRSGAHRVD